MLGLGLGLGLRLGLGLVLILGLGLALVIIEIPSIEQEMDTNNETCVLIERKCIKSNVSHL